LIFACDAGAVPLALPPARAPALALLRGKGTMDAR